MGYRKDSWYTTICVTLGLQRLVEVKPCSVWLVLTCASYSAGPHVGPVKVRAGAWHLHVCQIRAKALLSSAGALLQTICTVTKVVTTFGLQSCRQHQVCHSHSFLGSTSPV